MTGPSEPAIAVAAAQSVPARLLAEGEVIIMAIRPSGWFVLMVSWQVLAIAALLPLVLSGAAMSSNVGFSTATIAWICVIAAAARLALGGLQWVSRLYILTNLRVMRVRGVLKADIVAIGLKAIEKVELTATFGQRVLSIGSISFQTAKEHAADTSWIYVARPVEVRQAIVEAMSRLR